MVGGGVLQDAPQPRRGAVPEELAPLGGERVHLAGKGVQGAAAAALLRARRDERPNAQRPRRGVAALLPGATSLASRSIRRCAGSPCTTRSGRRAWTRCASTSSVCRRRGAPPGSAAGMRPGSAAEGRNQPPGSPASPRWQRRWASRPPPHSPPNALRPSSARAFWSRGPARCRPAAVHPPRQQDSGSACLLLRKRLGCLLGSRTCCVAATPGNRRLSLPSPPSSGS